MIISVNIDGYDYKITDEEAIFMANYIYEKDGIFVGGSSAVNLCAAIRAAKALGQGKTIVTILCDSGLKYTSKLFNKEILKDIKIKSVEEILENKQEKELQIKNEKEN